jgi:hypothetical protein
MEFEYEGHQKDRFAPRLEDVMRAFENLFREEMEYVLHGINARTKFEVLLNKNESPSDSR